MLARFKIQKVSLVVLILSLGSLDLPESNAIDEVVVHKLYS